MSDRPDGISEEAWDAAQECWQDLAVSGETRDEETAIIARAILKAREEAFEEAAKIAEDLNEWRDASDRDMAAVARRQQPLLAEVACAIRERAKKDVFEMSEAEIDAELVSRGIDPQEAIDATRSAINSVLSQAIRQHSQKGEEK